MSMTTSVTDAAMTPMADHIERFKQQLRDGWRISTEAPSGLAGSHYGGRDFGDAILAALTPPPVSELVLAKWPYQRTFNAIGAAVRIEGGAKAISVKAFIEAFGSDLVTRDQAEADLLRQLAAKDVRIEGLEKELAHWKNDSSAKGRLIESGVFVKNDDYIKLVAAEAKLETANALVDLLKRENAVYEAHETVFNDHISVLEEQFKSECALKDAETERLSKYEKAYHIDQIALAEARDKAYCDSCGKSGQNALDCYCNYRRFDLFPKTGFPEKKT